MSRFIATAVMLVLAASMVTLAFYVAYRLLVELSPAVTR